MNSIILKQQHETVMIGNSLRIIAAAMSLAAIVMAGSTAVSAQSRSAIAQPAFNWSAGQQLTPSKRGRIAEKFPGTNKSLDFKRRISRHRIYGGSQTRKLNRLGVIDPHPTKPK